MHCIAIQCNFNGQPTHSFELCLFLSRLSCFVRSAKFEFLDKFEFGTRSFRLLCFTLRNTQQNGRRKRKEKKNKYLLVELLTHTFFSPSSSSSFCKFYIYFTNATITKLPKQLIKSNPKNSDEKYSK